MSREVERVLQMLIDVKPCGKGHSARCPAHEDRHSSLSVGEGDDGRVLLRCHAGCSFAEICAALGVSQADLMPNVVGWTASSWDGSVDKPRIVASYDYCNEDREPVFQVIRYAPKGFCQRRPKPVGDWDWSVKGVRTVPYRLPELLADATALVAIVEGEKDVDNLAKIGIVATCNAGGAGKWTTEHSEFLRGRHAAIFADNDDAGRRHAEQVARSLHGIAASVRIVYLPGLPDKGDVSVWIEAGGTKDELLRLVDEAPLWKPAPAVKPGPVLTCLADIEPQEVEWLWAGRVPLRRITLLVGRPGEGKSFLTTDMAARVSQGKPWPDGSPCPKGSVVFISAEDDPADTIRPRLDASGADVNRVHLLSAVRRVTDHGQSESIITLTDVDAIEQTLEQTPDCKLLVVDPIGSFLGGKTDAHRDNEVRSVLAPIAKLAEKYGVAVLIVAHCRKGTATFADDTALGSRAFTGIARSVWHLRCDPMDRKRRLLLPGKNNLAEAQKGLAFAITGSPAYLEWEAGSVEMTADDALAAEANRKPGPDPEVLKRAVDWLFGQLARGPRPAKQLVDEWTNGEDGSDTTLKRAKGSLGVKSDKEADGWWWRLPLAEEAKICKDPRLGDLGDLGHLGSLEHPAPSNPEHEAPERPGLFADDDREAVII